MSLESITQFIGDAVDSLPAGDKIEPRQKEALIAACDKLKAAVETPLDFVFRLMMGTHLHSATRIAVEVGICDTMVGKSEGMTVQQLASAVKADAILISRIMRVLAAMGLFTEAGQGEYKATPLAGALISASKLSDAIIQLFVSPSSPKLLLLLTDYLNSGLVGEVLAQAPYYFAENGYQNPGDAYNGPFQYAKGTKLQYLDWLKENPKQQVAFNSIMRIQRMNRGDDWFSFYPVEEKLQVKNSDDPLLVDIGGGIGHDITAFQAKFPNLPGRLILEDLPVVIDDVKEINPGIEMLKYNFFEPRPVKGARAYYLQRIHEAMDEDSILLVNENVLADSHVPLYPAQLDLTMMALFAALDRTEKQFDDLFDSAGFRLVKVWKPAAGPIASATLFEAVKK